MGLTLLMGSLLEDFPGVTVQLVNLGGTLPFVIERLHAVAQSRQTAFPAERLRRMVYDTASLGPRAIETAARVLGADRLMLGTDYPIFQPASPQDDLAMASLDEAERTLIRQRNCRDTLAASGRPSLTTRSPACRTFGRSIHWRGSCSVEISQRPWGLALSPPQLTRRHRQARSRRPGASRALRRSWSAGPCASARPATSTRCRSAIPARTSTRASTSRP